MLSTKLLTCSMLGFVLFCLSLLSTNISLAYKIQDSSSLITYKGYNLLQVTFKDDQQRKLIENFVYEYENSGVYFSEEPAFSTKSGSSEIVVAPKYLANVSQFLKSNNLRYKTVSNDLGLLIRETSVTKPVSNKSVKRIFQSQNSSVCIDDEGSNQKESFFSSYRRIDDFYARLERLAKVYCNRVKVVTIGHSFENRPIYMLQIAARNKRSHERRKRKYIDRSVILVDGLHHAREWISASTAMYFIDAVLGIRTPLLQSSRKNQSRRRNRQRRGRGSRSSYKSVAKNYMSTQTHQDLSSKYASISSPSFDNEGLLIEESNGVGNENGNGYTTNLTSFDNYSEGIRNFERLGSFVSLSNKTLERLSEFEIWVIPIVNPDGYEYSHERDRMWRKTRRINSKSRCIGVDLNRNYPFYWNTLGASDRPCSDIYSGASAKSEPETKAVADTLYNNRDRILMYVTLHSYGQMILYPWGYKPILAQDNEELQRVATAGIKGMKNLAGTEYTSGSTAIKLYAASGGSDDYAKHSGIPYSYTIELPSKSNFLVHYKEITSIGRETADGIVEMIKAASIS